LVTNQKGNADRADGIAYTSDEKAYEISVTEGSKPYHIDRRKETSDYIQNGRAAKDLMNFVVISEVKLNGSCQRSGEATWCNASGCISVFISWITSVRVGCTAINHKPSN